jgi:hypothetical protein
LETQDEKTLETWTIKIEKGKNENKKQLRKINNKSFTIEKESGL